MTLLIVTIPFFSSIFITFLGRYIGYKGGSIIGVLSILLSTIISLIALIQVLKGETMILNLKDWFEVGVNRSKFEFIYDIESILMNNLISIITLIVIVYSNWYLSEDPHRNRFISKLLLFSVTMYILVSSKNFLFTFFGWEGVGVVSYLLINFWYNSPNNNKSAIKALLFNKVGDISYIMALLILAIIFNNYEISSIDNPSVTEGLLLCSNDTLLSLLLLFFLIAAMAKSAQIFLHCWLGDAMAGPTPVSALLHAATMVTAGIYLILKCSTILRILEEDTIRTFILIIGSLTIIFAGLSSLNQYDIKKIIAFSTCAQIGFMFLGLALYKPELGSLYHLITHGFFKALLFLSAGLIIHSALLEQDIRKYGNFIFFFPLFYIFFFIGTFAIIGLPPLSGFYSKDLILLHSFTLKSIYFPILLIIGSLLSSLYSFKLIYFTFINSSSLPFLLKSSNQTTGLVWGYTKLDSYLFLFPFFILILGSIFLGYFSSSILSSPETINLDLEFIISALDFNLKLVPFTLPFLGIFLIYLVNCLLPSVSSPFKSKFIHRTLSFFNRRFLFDTLYNFFLVLPTFSMSYHSSYKFLDRGILESFGPLGLFRLFYFFPLNYSILSQSSTNLPYIFFYFFFSFFVFFCIPFFIF